MPSELIEHSVTDGWTLRTLHAGTLLGLWLFTPEVTSYAMLILRTVLLFSWGIIMFINFRDSPAQIYYYVVGLRFRCYIAPQDWQCTRQALFLLLAVTF